MGARPVAAKAMVVFLTIIAAITICGFLVPWRHEVASEEGKGIDFTITYLLIVAGIFVVVGHAILVRFIWKSSANEPAAYGRPSKRAEWAWSVVPVVLMLVLSEAGVLFISGPVWDSLYAETPENPVILEVAGKQFEWYVRYPGKDGKFGESVLRNVNETDNLFGLDDFDDAAQDDIIKRGQIYLPVGRPAVIRLRTYDVIHSFFVPAFRVKQDLLPGYATRIKFTPTRTGEFDLACAELCGLGHYTMKGKVHVVEPAEFETWLEQQMTFGG